MKIGSTFGRALIVCALMSWCGCIESETADTDDGGVGGAGGEGAAGGAGAAGGEAGVGGEGGMGGAGAAGGAGGMGGVGGLGGMGGAGAAGGEGGVGGEGGEGGAGAAGGEGGVGGEGGGGAAGGEGGEGGEGGGMIPTCESECGRLADCSAESDSCPGVDAENRDAFYDGCLVSCADSPALAQLAASQEECEALVATFKAVNASYNETCEGGGGGGDPELEAECEGTCAAMGDCAQNSAACPNVVDGGRYADACFVSCVDQDFDFADIDELASCEEAIAAVNAASPAAEAECTGDP